ncbi:MAG: pyridoxamine 5'-phosphate oxidase [Sphingobacteriales bacterium]|nr:MAG: pyridoxamine 5'-phosphate oxidase [Sphingobacteriales bacterium]
MDIAAIRKDYQLAELDEATAGDDPLAFFAKWFAEAEAAKADEVNAMALATVDAYNKPHVRIVLLKGLEAAGFVFYTNYSSAKGHDIAANDQVATVFFWKELERQVRVEGRIEKISEAESGIYFNSRPAGSRLGAWASPQSQQIPGREILDNNYKLYQSKFGETIPRPPHWGGYRIVPERIEFWQGRSSRMHDRILFIKTDSGWSKSRLAP